MPRRKASAFRGPQRRKTAEPLTTPWARIVASEWAIPAFLALLHLVLAALVFHPAPFTGGDDATYISLARSLLQRHDYTDIWDPGLPPQTQYPPLFPAIVAIGLAAGLTPTIGLKILMLVISSAAVIVSCLWLRRVASPGIAFCAGFFIAVSPEVLRIGHEVLSDASFWLFAILALLAWRGAARVADRGLEGDRRMPVRWVLTATAATLAAYFTRSAGVPLLAATLVWLALRRDLRAALIVVAIATLLIAAWWLRGHAAGDGGYLSAFLSADPYDPSKGMAGATDMLLRVKKNVAEYVGRQFARLFVGTRPHGIFIGIPFAIAFVAGWARRLERPGLAEIWLPLYLGLVFLWPAAWSGPRFLLPVLPLMALYATEALGFIGERSTQPRTFAAALLVWGTIAARPTLARAISRADLCRARYDLGEQFPCTGPAFKEFFQLAVASRGKLPAGSVVLSRKPTIFFLYSGYRSRMYPMFTEPDSLFRLSERIGARFVVMDRVSYVALRYLHPVLLARRDDFCVIPELASGATAMARIQPGGPPRPPGSPRNAFRSCPLSPAR